MRKTELDSALRACRGVALWVAAFSFAINLLMLASPIYMMQVFNHVLSSRSTDTLIMLTLIVIAAIALLAVLDAVRGQVLSRVGLWIDDRLGPAVFSGSLKAALASDSARAAQGLRDLGTLRAFFSGPSVTPLLDAPWAPLFILSLFVLHPALGTVGIGGGVVLFALALLNELLTRAPLARANAAATRGHFRAEAALRNAEVIRSMGMTEGAARVWRADAEVAKEAQVTAGTRAALILSLSKFTRLGVQTLVLGVGAWLVIRQECSPGAMFASSFLLGRALAPVENAIGTWKSLVGARLAYRRLTELLAGVPAARPAMALPRPKGALSIERVSFLPKGAEEPTLRGVSFALQPGEVLGVIGPSAAGKSTLARLIAGSWAPTAGHVRLDGAEMQVWLDAGGAAHLGYLPQDVELFAGTVKDNIARLGAAEPEAVIEAATLVGLHEQIMRLPRAYDSDIGESGVKLSGGQRQRVGLARAVFGRPRLVVLDEPNASLDSEGEEALVAAIAHLKAQGTTVVVVAHRPSVLQHADKLLLLRNGTVDAFGDKPDIIAKLNSAAANRPTTIAGPRGPLQQTA